MRLTIEQLRAFTATVEQGGFRQAGARLGKHGSTIGQQVAGLEIDFDLQLFRRSGRSVTLTEIGDALYDHAKAVVREAEMFERQADSLSVGEPSKLIIAIDTSLDTSELPAIYDNVLQEFPAIKLELLAGDTMQVIQWVQDGRADLGYLLSTVRIAEGIAVSHCYRFEAAYVASPEFLDSGTIMRHTLRGMRQLVYAFFIELGLEDAHIESHNVIVFNNLNEAINQVIAGLGWAAVPIYACRSQLEKGLLRRFKVAHEGRLFWNAESIWRSDNPINPAMEIIIDGLHQLPDR